MRKFIVDDKYNITEIHYRDIYGNLLWKAPMVFKHLHAVNELIIYEYIIYKVKRVAVVENIQQVNIIKEE